MIVVLYYTAVGSLLLVLWALYRLPSKPSGSAFAMSLPGLVFWIALLMGGTALAWMRQTLLRSHGREKLGMIVALVTNAALTVFVLGMAESVVRTRAIDSLEGTRFRTTILHPFDWHTIVAHHGPILARMTREEPYFVHDPLLGWVVAPNRKSASGLYMSSREGLRSPALDLDFSDSRNRLAGRATRPARARIALLGDSMTFGHEVRCEESWAHLLDRKVGSEVQVLNFGVSGYGVSQAFLQYRRTVRRWHPQVVVMGITSADLLRMMSIYNFLIYPSGIEFPYARPRLLAGSQDWRPINQPIPTPQEIFSANSILDLPHLGHDRFFRPLEWPRTGFWGLLEHSWLFRFFASVRPLNAPLPTSHSDGALVELARGVLTAFLRDVEEDGAVPILVHLPYQDELQAEADGHPLEPPYGTTLLRQTGLPFVEMAPCLIAAKALQGFAPGGHYQGPANPAIAACLADVIQPILSRRIPALAVEERPVATEGNDRSESGHRPGTVGGRRSITR